MDEAERIVTELSRDYHKLNQLVRGNGSVEGSVMGRLKVLEDRDAEILEKLEEIANKPCRTPCIYEEAEKVKEKRRSFRSADIANWIAVAALAYIIITGLL